MHSLAYGSVILCIPKRATMQYRERERERGGVDVQLLYFRRDAREHFFFNAMQGVPLWLGLKKILKIKFIVKSMTDRAAGKIEASLLQLRAVL